MIKLKSTTYRFQIGAYGGEAFIGSVSREIYEYFKVNNIDLSEYTYDWDNSLEVPIEMQPFTPGSGYECDNLFHAYGASMDDINVLRVFDENDEIIWESSLSLDQLESQEIECNETDSFYFENIKDGDVVFYGSEGEKGTLYSGEIKLTESFDPKKIKLEYSDANGWLICHSITYNDEYIDNYDMSTTGKWSECEWIIGGDELVYESSDINIP